MHECVPLFCWLHSIVHGLCRTRFTSPNTTIPHSQHEPVSQYSRYSIIVDSGWICVYWYCCCMLLKEWKRNFGLFPPKGTHTNTDMFGGAVLSPKLSHEPYVVAVHNVAKHYKIYISGRKANTDTHSHTRRARARSRLGSFVLHLKKTLT